MRNPRLLLACFLPAKRDQQEACQKSRRDGDLLHRLVRLFHSVSGGGVSFCLVAIWMTTPATRTKTPTIPMAIPPAVDIKVTPIFDASDSGSATPSFPRVLKLPIIPIMVPNSPSAGPPRVRIPPPIRNHLASGFIFFCRTCAMTCPEPLARRVPGAKRPAPKVTAVEGYVDRLVRILFIF